jgi:hypothetical protein
MYECRVWLGTAKIINDVFAGLPQNRFPVFSSGSRHREGSLMQLQKDVGNDKRFNAGLFSGCPVGTHKAQPSHQFASQAPSGA